MSIGRNREEQELTALLARTLVQKEVMEPMNKIGWTHANPPPPDYSGQPATTEGAPATAQPQNRPGEGGQPAPAIPGSQPVAQAKADTPPVGSYERLVADFEAMRDPQTGLIAGKYPDIPSAIKGAGHLANMAKQSFQERDAARNELASLRTGSLTAAPATSSPVAAQTSAPMSLTAARADRDRAKADLDAVLSSVSSDDAIVDGEALRKTIVAQQKYADAQAEVRVQEAQYNRDVATEAEQRKWSAVDEFMKTNYPESLTRADEIGLHIAANPVLQAAVAALVKDGKEIQASVLAWRDYSTAVGNGTAALELAAAEHKEADLAARGQVRQELLDAARKDAGVIQGSAGGQGVHQNTQAARPSTEQLEALRAQMRLEGDAPGSPAAMAFRDLVIGPSLDPAIFGPR